MEAVLACGDEAMNYYGPPQASSLGTYASNVSEARLYL